MNSEMNQSKEEENHHEESIVSVEEDNNTTTRVVSNKDDVDNDNDTNHTLKDEEVQQQQNHDHDESLILYNNIKLPKLKYGYRTIPCKWDELIDIIFYQKDLYKLTRSEQQQYEYEIYKHNILKQWSSITDYVLCTKFPNVFTKKQSNHPQNQQQQQQQQRWKAHPSLQDITTTTHIKLIKNDFPYYLDDDIEHWILWRIGGSSSTSNNNNMDGSTDSSTITDNDIEHAKNELYIQHNIQKDYMIHWINPIELQSIPNIHHAHILCKVTKL